LYRNVWHKNTLTIS